MPLLTVSGEKELKRLLGSLDKLSNRIIPVATSQAINKTLGKLKTEASKAVREEANISARIAGRSLKITKSNKKTLEGNLDARQGRAFNLIENVSPSKRNSAAFRKRLKSGKYRTTGVKAKAYEQAKTYQGSFIGKGKTSGKTLVFARTGDGRGSKLKALFGPSLRKIFIRNDTQQRLQRKASKEFDIEFNRAFENEMRKATKLK